MSLRKEVETTAKKNVVREYWMWTAGEFRRSFPFGTRLFVESGFYASGGQVLFQPVMGVTNRDFIAAAKLIYNYNPGERRFLTLAVARDVTAFFGSGIPAELRTGHARHIVDDYVEDEELLPLQMRVSDFGSYANRIIGGAADFLEKNLDISSEEALIRSCFASDQLDDRVYGANRPFYRCIVETMLGNTSFAETYFAELERDFPDMPDGQRANYLKLISLADELPRFRFLKENA